MMGTDFNDSVADLSSDNNVHLDTKVVNHEKHHPRPQPCNSSGQPNEKKKSRPNEKKTVRFDVEHIATIPNISDMSSEEKQTAWYDSDDFDRFKYEAAKNAGVKIVRYDHERKGNRGGDHRHHFAMSGDFDSPIEESDAGIGTARSPSATKNDGILPVPAPSATASSAAENLRYNENEYADDRNDATGEAICRRGLGHHFSRARKRSRASARAAVVAWQATLLAASSPRSSDARVSGARLRHGESVSIAGGKGGGGGKLGGVERGRLMLALVSAKCSMIARKEAEWRGDVDYRVAYPELHASDAKSAATATIFEKKRSRDDSAHGIASKRGYTARNSAATCNVGCKRQRTSGGS